MEDPDAYYEAQYNNRLAIPDAAVYNARGVERSAAARSRLASRLDLAYGPSARQRIDLYPAAAAGAPILSFIHGGYWRSRDKSEFAFIAEPFVAAGITVAMPEYDLAPSVTVATIVEQMVAAHAWLYRNAGDHGADPSRLFVAGHSAGGHLAAMMAATHWNRSRPCPASRPGQGRLCGERRVRPDADAAFLVQRGYPPGRRQRQGDEPDRTCARVAGAGAHRRRCAGERRVPPPVPRARRALACLGQGAHGCPGLPPPVRGGSAGRSAGRAVPFSAGFRARRRLIEASETPCGVERPAALRGRRRSRGARDRRDVGQRSEPATGLDHRLDLRVRQDARRESTHLVGDVRIAHRVGRAADHRLDMHLVHAAVGHGQARAGLDLRQRGIGNRDHACPQLRAPLDR
jgi:hypothetical protein